MRKTFKRTIDVILLQDIEGIGKKLSVVPVDRELMRYNLYPKKQAVYAIEENVMKYLMKPYRMEKIKQEYLAADKELPSEEVLLAETEEKIAQLEKKRLEEKSKIIYPEWWDSEKKVDKRKYNPNNGPFAHKSLFITTASKLNL